MKSVLGLGWIVGIGVIVAACSGSQGATGPTGAQGKQGTPGTNGAAGTPATSGTASVSAITPPYAFQSRTVDLTIAGSGTSWDAATTVTFADPGVKVNKVTVASPAGLLVNVTLAATATVGPVDVTVADGKTSTAYKGAFEIKAPLAVTVTPMTGLAQGGLANIHVDMLDLTTPFDPNTMTVALSSMDVLTSTPSPTDYAFDLTVEAEVLAATGSVDLTVTNGATGAMVSSVAAKALSIVARSATALKASTPATGNIATPLDTELYELTPSAPAQQFVQFTVSSAAGQVSGTVLPKSGKFEDAIANGFAVRYGQGTTSTDPFYVVVADAQSFFGAGPTPADSKLAAFESACTAVSETPETGTVDNDAYATAQQVTTLPALVSGTLGYGSVTPDKDIDVYAITVTGTPKSIHVATGGDPFTDTIVKILDATGATVATSADDDLQEDLVFSATTDGTYYVSVAPSTSGNFSATDNTYQLFVSVN